MTTVAEFLQDSEDLPDLKNNSVRKLSIIKAMNFIRTLTAGIESLDIDELQRH